MQTEAFGGPQGLGVPEGRRVVRTTHHRSAWLLHTVVRQAVLCLSAGGYVFAPGVAGMGMLEPAQLVAPLAWWRTEAARGISEFEKLLAR